MAVVNGNDVVPVAPDVSPLASRDIADGRLHPRDLGQRLGEKRMLEDLGDAPLLAVHPPVLCRQPLGLTAAADEIVPHQGGDNGQQHAHDSHDPRQVGEERAPELLIGRRHQCDGATSEGHGLGGSVSLCGERSGRCAEQVGRCGRPPQIQRVAQLGERRILRDREFPVLRQGPLAVDDPRTWRQLG